MKRSLEITLAAATVMLFGLASSAPAQMVFHPLVKAAPTAGTQQVNRMLPSQGLTRIVMGEGRVYSPMSSVPQTGSAGVSAHTDVEVFIPNGFQPAQVSLPFAGYGFNTPASIACRYNVQSGSHVSKCSPTAAGLSNASGGSQTIAIVDAYDDPWIMDDLNFFSSQFDLPTVGSSNFQVVYAGGAEPAFDTKDDGGWELEESLDVEYAHAMAPNAKIVVVEATDSTLQNLLPAVQVAGWEVECGQATACGSQTGSGEVIMSWGTSEFSGETSDDSYFLTPGVVYFAAAGDEPGVSWPCSSQNVVCVGGTTFSRMPPSTPSLNPPGQAPFAGQQEGSWELSGGGSSAYEAIPSYQGVLSQTLSALSSATGNNPAGSPTGIGFSATNRAVPDVSANGNPYTGYWVYDSFQFALLGYIPPASDAPDAGGWWIVGGTSAANNIVAGIVNLAAGPNTVAGASNLGNGFQSSSANELTLMYSNLSSTYTVGTGGALLNSNFGDVLNNYGVCGPLMGFTPTPGWDPCSGIGYPEGVGGK